MAIPSDFQHKRKISGIDSGETENWDSSDGGTTWHPQMSDADGRSVVLTGLIPHSYDYISLSYEGNNLTGVEYKEGGSLGTVVATLSLAYNINNDIISITKS
jgi:hypothetical protein